MGYKRAANKKNSNVGDGGSRLDDEQQQFKPTNIEQSFHFVQLLRMMFVLMASYLSPNFGIGYYSYRLSMYLLPNHCISNIVYVLMSVLLSLSQSVLAMDGSTSTVATSTSLVISAAGAAVSLAHSFLDDAPHNNADPNDKSQKIATTTSYGSIFSLCFRNTKVKGTDTMLVSSTLTAPQPRAINKGGKPVPVLRWDRVLGWNWTCAAFDKLPLPLQKLIGNPNPPIRCYARGIDAPYPILLTAGCLLVKAV